MAPPEKRNAKNIVGNTAEISNVVLTTLNDAAISAAPVPYLQQAAGLALGTLKVIQEAKDNKDAFHQLAADTCELVYVALCVYEEVTKGGGDHGPLGKLVDDLQGLLGTISSVERFSRKEATRGALFRLFRNKNDLAKIQDFRDTLQLSLGLFELQRSVAIREDASQLIDQNEKILLELQRRREQDTAVTRIAAPAPVAVEQKNAPVAPIGPVSPTLKAEMPMPVGTVTHIGGDKIESHSLNNVTSMNSGNTTITTTSNSNNDNSYRQYGRKPGRRPFRRGRRK